MHQVPHRQPLSRPLSTKLSRDISSRQAQVRASIADLAARLMAEHGIHDYGQAKRKAARQLNLPDGHGWPSNEEIDMALIERQALFDGPEQTEWLTELRTEALKVMLVFAKFEPSLTGAVASGAVAEHSQIELEILVGNSKEFEQHLVNQEIEFKVLDRGAKLAYLVYAEPADVLIHLSPLENRHSRRQTHLSIKQLEKLLGDRA